MYIPELLIPLMPLLGFAVIALAFRRDARLAPRVSIAFTSAAFVLAVWVGVSQLADPVVRMQEFTWLKVTTETGADLALRLGTLVDPLAGMMLFVVTLISLLVQVYSLGYLQGDPGLPRYYLWISLFSFSMLGLVLAPNLFQIYIFWELVGLCSYLLIGFWYHKTEAADAAKKAFVVNRVGDFGFFLGILFLSYYLGTANFLELPGRVAQWPLLGPSWMPLGVVALLLFMGAMGKSAQFPLHVWLPDAMEGPTPVSALIHAATMVAAGVYLVARVHFVFELSALTRINAQTIMAYVGGFTSLYAALIACTQNDIKKVLAYSTLSQLGYMIMALGCGESGAQAGPFHLFTHAWFKALLFLGAGSVIHAVHGQDIRKMGGLFGKMPLTAGTFLVACLAISGIPPLSGFFSKDMIVDAAFDSRLPGLFPLALGVAFLTAFYMFRLFFMTFTGAPRDTHAHEHAHESPNSMVLPLLALCLMTVFAGFIDSPFVPTRGRHFLAFEYHPPLEKVWHASELQAAARRATTPQSLPGEDLGRALPGRQGALDSAELLGHSGMVSDVVAASPRLMIPYSAHFNWVVFVLTLGASVGGIWLATAMYFRQRIDPARVAARFGPLYTASLNKFYGDEAWTFVLRQLYLRLSAAIAWFDRHVVDGFMNLLAWLSQRGGEGLRRVQTGQLQAYALAVFAGAALLLLLAYGFLR